MKNIFLKIITIFYVIVGILFLLRGYWAIILFLVPSWFAWLWIFDSNSDSPDPDKYNRSNNNFS